VELTTVTLLDALDPNLTAVAPFRFMPVIVTVPPPVTGEESGVMEDTIGVTFFSTVRGALASRQELPTELGQLLPPLPLYILNGLASNTCTV
jgi:hypothetical protein